MDKDYIKTILELAEVGKQIEIRKAFLDKQRNDEQLKLDHINKSIAGNEELKKTRDELNKSNLDISHKIKSGIELSKEELQKFKEYKSSIPLIVRLIKSNSTHLKNFGVLKEVEYKKTKEQIDHSFITRKELLENKKSKVKYNLKNIEPSDPLNKRLQEINKHLKDIDLDKLRGAIKEEKIASKIINSIKDYIKNGGYQILIKLIKELEKLSPKLNNNTQIKLKA